MGQKNVLSVASFALCFLNYKVRNIYLDIENLLLYPDYLMELHGETFLSSLLSPVPHLISYPFQSK